MNKWVKKSIDLANSKGYLDNLNNIYPFNLALTASTAYRVRAFATNVIGTSYGDTVDYTTAGSSAIKTLDGLAKASVKTIDGLAIASVKTYNGLA